MDSTDDKAALTVHSRSVGTLLGRQMVDIPSGSTLRQVVAKLVDDDVGVIVVRGNDGLVGILSERDVMDAVHDRVDLDAATVDSIMQSDIITIPASASVVEAGRTMIERGVRHLLVEGPDGDGIVSIRAILRSILS